MFLDRSDAGGRCAARVPAPLPLSGVDSRHMPIPARRPRRAIPLCFAATTACLLAASVLSPACVSSAAKTSERSGPLGTFSLSGPAFGSRELLPGRCSTGQHELFLGFDLRDESAGYVVRLVVDPATGPVVKVFETRAPFDRTVLFHRSECRVFHFSIDATGWRINRTDQLKISLELDCELPSGDRIAGKAQDSGCL